MGVAHNSYGRGSRAVFPGQRRRHDGAASHQRLGKGFRLNRSGIIIENPVKGCEGTNYLCPTVAGFIQGFNQFVKGSQVKEKIRNQLIFDTEGQRLKDKVVIRAAFF